MKRSAKVLGIAALIACAPQTRAVVASPGEGGPPGGPHGGFHGGPEGGPGGHGPHVGGGRGPGKGGPLARAADADASGDVTDDEWTAFFAAIDGDADGIVDLTALVAALPAPPHEPPPGAPAIEDVLAEKLDRDGDGVVEVDDLRDLLGLSGTTSNDGTSTATTSSKNATSQSPRLRGHALKAARALARAADADASGDVSAAESDVFLDGLTVDGNGAVSLDDLASKLPACRGRAAGAARRAAGLLNAFDADADGDGALTRAELQAAFDRLDRNADGALAPDELHSRR